MSIIERKRDMGQFLPQAGDEIIICRCEEITRGEIRRAVHAGLYTMTEIRRFLRAGMGLCQGNTCSRLVKGIIAGELGMSPAELEDCTARGPARPVTITTFGNEVERSE